MERMLRDLLVCHSKPGQSCRACQPDTNSIARGRRKDSLSCRRRGGTAGTVQVVVDDARRAKKALDAARIAYTETPAEQYDLPNKPGALAQSLEKLAAKGVNLNSIHATAAKGGKKAVVVYTVEAAAQAATASP